MVSSREGSGTRSPRRPPARTPEAREQELISLAYELAEKQLREGTASSQIITQLLKGGTQREKVEQERLRNENLLAQAKIENMKSGERIEEMYTQAMRAMTSYQSGVVVDEPED